MTFMNLILTALFFLQTPATSTQKMAAEKKEIEALSQMHESGGRSTMIIDPKARATDYVKAWQMLKQEKSTSKVAFTLAGGKRIANVIEMTPMPGDTLIVFRYSTPQGVRFQVVAIEDILGVSHE
jgi:hypothetical protein